MARLPFSDSRINERNMLDLRRINDRDLPRMPQHPIRQVDDIMKDLVANLIDLIQEVAEKTPLRTFYFNMMSENGYENKEFEKLVELAGFFLDYELTDGRSRDLREAMDQLDKIVGMSTANVAMDYPDLIERREERAIEEAARVYDSLVDMMRERGRGNGRGSRGRDRDDRGGRGSDRFTNRDNGSSNRRYESNRGAIRGSRRGEPADRFSNREDESDRTDPRDEIEDRRLGREESNDRGSDRFDDRRRDKSSDRATPHMPGAREERQTESANAAPDKEISVTNKTELAMTARDHETFWAPSQACPHPLAINRHQELNWVITLAENSADGFQVTRSHITDIDPPVNYDDHASLAFGTSPKNANRFITKPFDREEELKAALENENIEVPAVVEGVAQLVNAKRRLDVDQNVRLVASSYDDLFVQLEALRVMQEEDNRTSTGGKEQAVELATAQALQTATLILPAADALVVDSILKATTPADIVKKMRDGVRNMTHATYMFIDRRMAAEVMRVVRQNLSVPNVGMTSFVDSYADMIEYLTNEFGQAYADLLAENIMTELKIAFHTDATADLWAEKLIGMGESPALTSRTYGVETKLVYINEGAANLNLDMIPDVASQLLSENVPFFYDLANTVIKEAGPAKRFLVATRDRRVIELSRGYLGENALLARVIV
jgi:hypothetical protein